MWQSVVLVVGILLSFILAGFAVFYFVKDRPNRKRVIRTGIPSIVILLVAIAPSIVSSWFISLPMLIPSGQFACVSGNITIDGSTAMMPLIQDIASDYMSSCPGATITVSGGGSQQGLTDVENGRNTPASPQDTSYSVQIGDSDTFRTELLAPDRDTDLDDYVVAGVQYVVIVSQALHITNLSTDDLQKIYNGTYTNWGQLGHGSSSITAISREDGSGTRRTFEKYVLLGSTVKADNTTNTDNPYPIAPGTSDVATYMQTPGVGAIGYVTLYEATKSNLLKNVTIVSIDGHRYTDFSDNSYKFWTLEHMFIKKASAAADPSSSSYQLALAFINYTKSKDAQQTITTDSFLNWGDVSGIWSTHYSG